MSRIETLQNELGQDEGGSHKLSGHERFQVHNALAQVFETCFDAARAGKPHSFPTATEELLNAGAQFENAGIDARTLPGNMACGMLRRSLADYKAASDVRFEDNATNVTLLRSVAVKTAVRIREEVNTYCRRFTTN